MQRFKASSSLLVRHFIKHRGFISSYRSLSSVSSDTLVDDPQSVVLVEGKARSRTAVFNRPSSLNAINSAVVDRLYKLYTKFEADPGIDFVVLKGKGRAFSAGGDIVSLYTFINEGSFEKVKEFFWTLNNHIYIVGTYLKPNVALLNGITMGGGGGVSVPGIFQVATDKTVFALPETLIGYHLDGAASFYLSRLPGCLGEYLGLTGERLNGVEMVSCGLATHYSSIQKLPLIEAELGKLMTGSDPSVVETCLQNFSELALPDQTSVIHRMETIDKCFGHDTVEEIIDAVESEAGKTQEPWCVSALSKLRCASPLSLKVCLRSIREGRFQSLDQCLVREYRMSLQGLSRQINNDFCEGVRATLVDRDHAPKWDPPRLEQVSEDMVDQYFSPLSAEEPDLELPVQQREAFA